MPYIVRKAGPKKFLIVNQKTGEVVGHSTSVDKAYRSIGYRMEGEKNKRKARA